MWVAKARAGLLIGAAARRAGVNVETIRYYEREGIVPRPARTAGGQRVYSAAGADRLAFVRRARELGFTLGEIHALARLATGPGEACDDVLAIARASSKCGRRFAISTASKPFSRASPRNAPAAAHAPAP